MPETAPSPETPGEPTERDGRPALRTVFLGGLLALALLAACYAAAAIVLPIVLAFVLNAVFQPVLRFLVRLGVPRVLAALVIVLVLVSLFAVLGLLLSGPIAGWITQLPHTLPRLQERLRFLNAPLQALQNALANIQHLAPGAGPPALPVAGPSLAPLVLGEFRIAVVGAFTTLLVLFFVLVSGEQFLRRLIDILPDSEAKRRAADIAHEIEHDISIYLATITMMNTIVGVLTGGMAALTGLGDPLLWGSVAFLLNYVPILGPTVGVVLFLVAGLVTIQPLWAAFVPPALYLVIHLVEGETVTPMLLAARFTVNPVLVTLGVIFWYWMWGVVGAVLSTPMLAIAKIVCDRIDALKPVGHFIGGAPVIFPAKGKAAR
jgi:predicted PurR-regulated permease PerM